jgi:DNA (cytosine-5)-methyltransferase 1
MKTITTGSDFSGVGAFDYAMDQVSEEQGFQNKRVFACDWDKFARISYVAAHGQPDYFPEDVYEREIPTEPLDIYMTSPPCQSFSLAGKREGKNSDKGVLFFNSHEFIKKNNPRYFIFENVKGLLSDDKGRTFQEWINFLGGKSVNGLPILFKDENAVDYHIYWKVLNSKKHGVSQNRERVFIVGIRDDQDNSFTWPKEEHLTTKLKDVLENEVDEKYFLSDKSIQKLVNDGIDTDHLIPGEVNNTIRVGGGSSLSAKHSFDMIKIVGNTNPSGNGMNGNVYHENGISPTLSTNKGEGIKVVQLNPSKESGGKQPYQQNRIYNTEGITPALNAELNGRMNILDGYRIRRLTPLECFRLQDFPDSHVEKCRSVKISDSQLYKQAGNSITRRVLKLIISKLSL